MNTVNLEEVACKPCVLALAQHTVQVMEARGAHIDPDGDKEWSFNPDDDEEGDGNHGHMTKLAVTDADTAIRWLGRCKCGAYSVN